MKLTTIKTTGKTLMITATLALGVGCASPGKRTAIGAGAGAAGGAAIGAIAGGGKGALIGAGIGAVAGGAIGNRLDKQAQELSQVAETKRTEEGILVNLKNDLLFETGKSNLSSEAQGQLRELAGVLVKYPNDVIHIAGHTDSTGSNAVNKELSQERAAAVKLSLLENGVKPAQLSTTGLGESNPVADNKTATGRAKNRRVELIITDIEAERAKANSQKM